MWETETYVSWRDSTIMIIIIINDVYISLWMHCVPLAFTKSGIGLKPFPCSEFNSWCLAEPSLEAQVSDSEPS